MLSMRTIVAGLAVAVPFCVGLGVGHVTAQERPSVRRGQVEVNPFTLETSPRGRRTSIQTTATTDDIQVMQIRPPVRPSPRSAVRPPARGPVR